MAVGRPIKLTPNVARKQISVTATASQTDFTPTGGYRVNELGVYRNGVRLVQGRDFTAVDGATVTLLSGATVDDVIDFVIFDTFNIADALNSNSDNTVAGDFTVGGDLTSSGVLKVSDTTESTTKDTGSVIIEGGVLSLIHI